MSEPFIAEIKMFAGNFAPRGYAFCDGQLLPISQNTALFSLVGTTYGGDGRTTLGLPDLRGRSPMHAGTGPGLAQRRLGQKGGVQTVTLSEAEMPAHTHRPNCVAGAGTSNDAVGNFWADDAGVSSATYHPGPAANQMNAAAIPSKGGSQPHTNEQPYQCVNFIIALTGVFPSRN